MKPDLHYDYITITPEIKTAVFARKAKGHSVTRRIEDAEGETWVYLTDTSFGKKCRTVLEIRDTIEGERVVYMTMCTGIFVNRSTAVLDEIFECNAAVRKRGAAAPVIAISDERDELVVERCIPLDDNITLSLKAAEIDCVGLSIALERHFDEFYCIPHVSSSKTVIEEEETVMVG